MAIASSKPCSSPGCGTLVPRGMRYCKTHGGNNNWGATQAQRTKKYNARTGTTRWKKFRQAIVRRDKGMCQSCLRVGLYRAGNEVDHIRPLSAGGAEYDPDNVELLCRSCHAKKTASEARAARQ